MCAILVAGAKRILGKIGKEGTESGMDVRLGDILEMKKPHPCGSKRFAVLRVGMDFRLKCEGCGHEMLVPRVKIERNIRRIHRQDDTL